MGTSRVPTPRRARLGVSLMFFTNGVLFAALLPRYPEIKAAFALSNSEFGLVVVAFPTGALLAAALAGRVIRRFGTLRTNAVGSVALAAGMAVAGVSADAGLGVALFVMAMLVAGATDAVVDAAQNVQGVLVEQWRGRSAVNSFHALWSIGAATGGLIGAGAVAADVAVSTQMIVNSVVWAVAAVIACRLAGAVRREPGPPGRGGPRVVRARHPASPTLAPAPAPGGAGRRRHERRGGRQQLVGAVSRPRCRCPSRGGRSRTHGRHRCPVRRAPPRRPDDRPVGPLPVARAGGLLIALGGVLVVAAPGYLLVFVGFALAGFGSATLVPAAFAAAGRVPGLAEGTGIALLGWLMRIGFLVTSPAIGGLSDLVSLQAALGILVLAGIVAATVAHAQRGPGAVR